MLSSTNLRLGKTDQDSVSMVGASPELCLPLSGTAPEGHGTRPPISPLGIRDIHTPECNPNQGNANPRPPPAPSISDSKPPFNLTLPHNKQRAKRSCLKIASPLSSPSLSSQDVSPASNYTTFHHTLGGLGSSPSTPGSDPTRSTGSSGSSTPKKSVSWCSQEQKGLGYLEEVFPADDWDRTPTEPARIPLSYKDILELKAIQRTLPHAQQLPDPFTGKPGNQYLSDVPIALLPLLPDSAPHTPLSTPNISPDSSTGVTPNASGSNTPLNTSPRGSQEGSPQQSIQPSPRQSPRGSPVPSPIRSPSHSPERGSCSPAHAHLPRISSPLAPPPPPSRTNGNSDSHTPPSRPRNKPVFNFIPLLDNPPASAPTSPPLDPIPRALDAALGILSIRRQNELSFNQNEEESPPVTPALTFTSSGTDVDTELSDFGEDIPFGVMFRKDAEGSFDSYSGWRGRSVEKKKKETKKNVICINGEEIDLGGADGVEDEDEDEESGASTSCANVIYINGEACALDDSDAPPPPLKSRSRSTSPSPPVETERKSRSQSPISPFHRAHPNVGGKTVSPPPPERKSRCQVPISPFHRAHPNVAGRSRTPSPAADAAEKTRPPVSAFHRAHPNIARSRTPSPAAAEETRLGFGRAYPNGRSRSPLRD